MVYNESANNSTVTVSTGKEFVIELRENLTTGYSWNATGHPGTPDCERRSSYHG